MNRPDISFVIIEYHSLPDVAECAEAIAECCRELDFEIIVSSNSTYPASEQQRLQIEMTQITWVFNRRNGGFAQGMNAGLERSTGKIVVITNPDVRIKAGSVREAITFIAASDRIGVLGPRIVDGFGNLQDSCRPFITPVRLAGRLLNRFIKSRDVLLENKFDYSRVQRVDWVIGAFMMIQREALTTVGGLDQGYFLYVEDMDWCKRFWDRGFEVVYYPSLTVEYKGDRKSTTVLTSKNMINKYSWFHLKSYCRFLKKHGFFPAPRSNQQV